MFEPGIEGWRRSKGGGNGDRGRRGGEARIQVFGREQLAFPCAFSGTKPNLLLAASGGDQAWFTVLLTD